jgi:histidyl-tRNA synthetase
MFALIIGENELKAGKVQWKNLLKKEQGEVAASEITSIFMK